MLSLKMQAPSRSLLFERSLMDLPDELLELVLLELQDVATQRTRALLPISMACSRLRRITAPFIFHTIHLRLTDRYVDKRTFNILLNCNLARHGFTNHIRHIVQDDTYCFRENNCEDLRISNELVRGLILQALRSMINLTSIRQAHSNSVYS